MDELVPKGVASSQGEPSLIPLVSYHVTPGYDAARRPLADASGTTSLLCQLPSV